MAFAREEFDIRLGSVNLVAPGDKIPGEDALEVTNFRVDRYGHLRSRKGNSNAEQLGAALTFPIHTSRRLAGRRYWGRDDELRRDAVQIVTGMTATARPWGLAVAGRYVWIMNQATGKQLRDDGATVLPWLPAAPTTAPSGTASGSGGITGDYQYYVTFGTAAAVGQEDFETNPGPASAVVSATGALQINLTGIPTAAGGQGVNCRHIYRVGGDLSEATWVATIYDNTTTTFSDFRLDSEIADDAAARLMETDHDPPPAANGIVHYMERLVAFRDPANPRRVYYTPAFKYWYFPGSANTQSGNYFDVDDDVIAISVKPRALYIYTKTTIWRVNGDIEENPAELTRSDYGAVSPRGVVSSGLTDYFRSREGMCAFNGDQARLISPKLDPLFHDDAAFIARGAAIQHNPFDADPPDLFLDAMTLRTGRIWLSCFDTTGARQTWIYEIATDRWVKDSRQLFGFLNEGDAGELIGCFYRENNGSIPHYGAYNLEDSNTDGAAVGGSYDLRFHSAYHDQGQPEKVKVYEDITLDIDTAGLNVAVKVYTNNGELPGDEYNLGIVNTATRQQVTIPIGDPAPPATPPAVGIRGRNLALRIECTQNSASAVVILFRAFAHYYIEPRAARTFDTGEVDLGIPWVKTYERALLHIAATATVRWTFYTELPGGAMAVRSSGTIGATSGPTKVPLVLGGHEGRLMRLTLYCESGVFQLFDGVGILTKPLPEYHNGANGEIFLTLEQRIAA